MAKKLDLTDEEQKILKDRGFSDVEIKKINNGEANERIQKQVAKILLHPEENPNQREHLLSFYNKKTHRSADMQNLQSNPNSVTQLQNSNNSSTLVKNAVSNKHFNSRSDTLQEIPEDPAPVVIVKLNQTGLPIIVSPTFRQQMLSSLRSITNTSPAAATPRAVAFVLKKLITMGSIVGAYDLDLQEQGALLAAAIDATVDKNEAQKDKAEILLKVRKELFEEVKKFAKKLGFKPENFHHEDPNPTVEHNNEAKSIYSLRPKAPGLIPGH